MEVKCDASPDFTTEDDLTDVALVVEGKKLYTSKVFLSMMSPVFKAMFYSDFKEKDQKEVELPGKSFEDIRQLLSICHPGYRIQLTAEICFQISPLADEYQMFGLKDQASSILCDKIQNGSVDLDFLVMCLDVAYKCTMMDVWGTALTGCAEKNLKPNDWEKCIALKNVSPFLAGIVKTFGIQESKHLSEKLEYAKKIQSLEKNVEVLRRQLASKCHY